MCSGEGFCKTLQGGRFCRFFSLVLLRRRPCVLADGREKPSKPLSLNQTEMCCVKDRRRTKQVEFDLGLRF